MGDERLLYRMAAGDQFLVLAQEVGRRRTGGRARPRGAGSAAGREGTVTDEPAGAGAIVGAWGRPDWSRTGRTPRSEILGDRGVVRRGPELLAGGLADLLDFRSRGVVLGLVAAEPETRSPGLVTRAEAGARSGAAAIAETRTRA
jgi:hypothetical protein